VRAPFIFIIIIIQNTSTVALSMNITPVLSAYFCGLQKSKETVVLGSSGLYCKINAKLCMYDFNDLGFKGMIKELSLTSDSVMGIDWLIVLLIVITDI
jgi:hypothetical protein